MKTIKLKAGKERSALRFHPWVFDSAIAKGGGDPGETVRVESNTGQFLGWASFSPTSKIRARIWSFQSDERIDATFFERQVAAAVAMRARLQVPSNGVRLIHGEADGLPGLIVDRYDDTLVAQFLSAGTERFKSEIVKALVLHTDAKRVFERSDSGVRGLEGLPSATGWLFRAEGASDDTAIVIQEHDWALQLDIAEGHKTGFYLDQRDSRLKFAEYARRLNLRQVLKSFQWIHQDQPLPRHKPMCCAMVLIPQMQSSWTPMSMPPCAACTKRDDSLMASCSTRPNSRPVQPMQIVLHVLIKTSTVGRSNCWHLAEFCSPTVVRAAFLLSCFTKLWPLRVPIQGWMPIFWNGCKLRLTTP